MAYKYFRKADAELLYAASTFEELRDIAFRVLSRMPTPMGQVCGPIASGGTGSVQKNIKKMRAAVRTLQRQGLVIFDQTPFERPMQRIKKSDYFLGEEHLLGTFYLPIFESGFVRILYFLPDWHTSYGARWEHEQAQRLVLQIVYI